MRSMMVWLALAGAACTSVASGAEPPPRPTLALAPAALGRSLVLDQRVRVELPDRSVSLDAVVQVGPDSVTVVALSMGERVLTIVYDGHTVKEQRAPKLPVEVHGADILSDMQTALWPEVAVRTALPEGWTLVDAASSRVLSYHGRAMLSISYAVVPHWAGEITVRSERPRYTLVIASREAAP
jgi:hypothetical protein